MLEIYLKSGRVINGRKYLSLALVALILIVAAIALGNYLTTGQLTVTTNSNKNLISITKTYGLNQAAKTTPAVVYSHSGQTQRLSPGTYQVTVSSAYFSTQQQVTVRAGKNIRVYIKLNSVSPLEPVAGIDAAGMAEGNNQLLYLDLGTSQIYQINNQNQIQNISGSTYISSVEWASSSFGVAIDTQGNFYVINNGTISPLKLSFTYQPTPSVVYAVAPNNQIYISYNNQVYRGDSSGAFNQIYTTQAPVAMMAAANQSVAIGVGVNSDTENSQLSGSFNLYVINQNNQIISSSVGEVTQMAWSKSGKYLAASINGQLVIFTNNLKKIASLSANGIGSMTWLNDSSVIYAISSYIWDYNLAESRASLLSQSTTGQTATELKLNDDGSYIFVTLTSSQQETITYEIAKIGLASQQMPASTKNLLDSLTALLPNTVTGCSLNYVNFTELAVTYQNTASTHQDCLSAAKNYLSTYGLNTNQLSFESVGSL